MTDLDLMEAAARAAGMDVHRGEKWQADMLFRSLPRPNSSLVANVEWNPLTDDGDALRLAVKLRLSVSHHNDVSQPHPWLRVTDQEDRWTHAGPSQEFNADPYAATRRAIVRAAAEIGRAMP